MEELIKTLGAYGPQYVLLGLGIIAALKSGALKALFSKNGKYVTKEACHQHIDNLKNEIADTRADLKEHINGVDRKVDMLLENALK
jgi:uncharacterized membrane-anchored protein YhcB (DUF1043 family)